CFVTGVKRFQYKERSTYKLHVFVDDGSLISEILIEHSFVQKKIGYSPEEAIAASRSAEMKSRIKEFQEFLANFEGTMVLRINEASSLPTALDLQQGCPPADAWSLLTRLKPRNADQRPQLDPIDLSPVFQTIVDWRTSAPKDGMPADNTYSPEAVIILNTHRTPIQKQPEALLCLVGLSRKYYMGDEVYPTFLHDDDRGGYLQLSHFVPHRIYQTNNCYLIADMDLFSLIRAPNPTKVKTGSRPRAAHEVPLLTVTANRVIEMKDPATTTDSSGVPSTIERSPLDFAHEDPSQQLPRPEDQEATVPEVPPPRIGYDGVDSNAPPKVLRRDHADPRPTESTREGKSLAAIELGMGSIRPAPASQGAPVDVSDPDLLSFAGP
nr:RecQ-mediated genome instability protein 1 [Tanacetum cinerariifolium]